MKGNSSTDSNSSIDDDNRIKATADCCRMTRVVAGAREGAATAVVAVEFFGRTRKGNDLRGGV
jgi:hypothetical protein